MTELTPQEHARRLNMCQKAGLNIICNCKTNPIDSGWDDWSLNFNSSTVTEIDLDYLNFLVLRPGETVDNFVIEN